MFVYIPTESFWSGFSSVEITGISEYIYIGIFRYRLAIFSQMKYILSFSLTLLLSHIACCQGTMFVYFAEEYSPNCKTLFCSNGRYFTPNLQLVEVDLPNTISVLPHTLTWNNLLRFHSFAVQAEKLGTIKIDRYSLTPYSRDEVLELIYTTKDSMYADWLISHEVYLWQTFNIVRDAKPPPGEVEVDTLDIDYMGSGIIDGVFLKEELKYVRIEPGAREQIPDSYYERSEKVQKEIIQPKLDSLLQPFYFSNFEVTNREYREFVDWVADSIELQIAYDNLTAYNASLLLDCSRKEFKTIDSTRKADNLDRFGLSRKNIKKIDDKEWFKATKTFYYPAPERFYTRRQRNAENLIYKGLNGTRTPVYPDTAGFSSVDQLGVNSIFLTNLSFWHPAYDSYPIVNVSKEQILAYCHWKQCQLNKIFQSKGVKVTVRPPTITEYEFTLKTIMGGDHGHYYAIDQSNDNYHTFERSHIGAEFIFYREVDYEPTKRKKALFFGGEPSLNYMQWYQANQSNSSVKFLNGNVSEFVLDQVTEEKLKHYRMKIEEDEAAGNFVLGSNYIQGVKAAGDDQYNSIFHKTILRNGESSPFVGFRLVYIVEKIE